MATNKRKSLSDIVSGSDRESLEKLWGETEAAASFAPIPKGTYVCRVRSGEPFASKRGTRGYKIALEIFEGDQQGKRLWHDLWLTGDAMQWTKRDLAEVGIKELKQLDRPIPPGILVKVGVVLHKNDDGEEFNKVRSFKFSRPGA